MSERSVPPRSAIVCGLLFAVIVGYAAGRQSGFVSVGEPLRLRPDVRQRIPVIRIDGIRNGNLEGMMQGDVRFIMGSTIVVPDGSGALSVSAGPLLRNEVSIVVPKWAAYVASKRGTRYYGVDTTKGAGIVPGNRVYFRSRSDAEAAGYKSGD